MTRTLIANLTPLFGSERNFRLDGERVRSYHAPMKCLCICSSWRFLAAAFLVALLAFAPALQVHAAAAHPDHFAVQVQQDDAAAQRADCCIDGESTDHVMGSGCSSCVLPCMSAVHALVPSLNMTSYFASGSHLITVGQVMGGLAAAPDLRPPKTRS